MIVILSFNSLKCNNHTWCKFVVINFKSNQRKKKESKTRISTNSMRIVRERILLTKDGKGQHFHSLVALGHLLAVSFLPHWPFLRVPTPDQSTGRACYLSRRAKNMANLRTDSPISRRIVLAFLDFLNSGSLSLSLDIYIYIS